MKERNQEAMTKNDQILSVMSKSTPINRKHFTGLPLHVMNLVNVMSSKVVKSDFVCVCVHTRVYVFKGYIP